MKVFFITLFTCWFLNSSLALEVGDDVSLEALAGAEFLKGEAPKEWEKDKVYIVECWATWCGPCIAVIPHVDELYDTYHEKGLEVIGMNVREEVDLVTSFIEKKGDGMSYPVAIMKEGSAFSKEWYDAAGVQGIPHSFVIKGGKLIMQGHPSSLTNEVIEKLLNSETDLNALMAEFQKENDVQEKSGPIVGQFFSSKEANEEEGMKTALAEAEALDKDLHQFLQMNYYTYKKNWNGVKEIFNGDSGNLKSLAVSFLVETDKVEKVDGELLKLVEPHIEVAIPGFNPILKSRINTKLGDREKALDYAKKALKEIKKDGRIPEKPFEEFIKSLEEGSSMTIEELELGIRDATQQ